jgi:hypothetical protein
MDVMMKFGIQILVENREIRVIGTSPMPPGGGTCAMVLLVPASFKHTNPACIKTSFSEFCRLENAC